MPKKTVIDDKPSIPDSYHRKKGAKQAFTMALPARKITYKGYSCLDSFETQCGPQKVLRLQRSKVAHVGEAKPFSYDPEALGVIGQPVGSVWKSRG
jgi:hypothetical protein